ncbi:DUF4185 domain-containing protein [Mycobacterium asiaticum]|uniref:DUF4185 domain-containing protein n=1 Tax=Mycobacterium asiaticum TaxID=1790 RepID=A0A1A3NDN9_MYCAS|nr:DUF4185 domain-containing protein [Mycobacterium asiaticum]OBK19916.1 hypothetical protein A5636_17190 [Mycobacterium asiaticum]
MKRSRSNVPGALAFSSSVLAPGQARNLGAVAGTGARRGIRGIGAADLGEVVRLPNGKQVAVFGDAFRGDHVGADPHYPSVAVPVSVDAAGRLRFGRPLTGPSGSRTVLFPPPPQAHGRNTLPAGSIELRDGTTYMMVTGTRDLVPDGGSWLAKVTDDPAAGWRPVDRSWRPWTPLPDAGHPTQISGYQSSDGNVYIAADSFDRTRPVTMYCVDPAQVSDRSAWRPWTGAGWGRAGDVNGEAISPGNYGELSFREIDGRPVLVGFDASIGFGAVRVQVGRGAPNEIFSNGAATLVMQQHDPDAANFVPQNYGGFILPGCTLDNLHIFGSQWHTPKDGPQIYNTQHIVVHPHR